MDLLRFAEIEPHAIISIKLIMDLLRFVKTNLGFESYFSGLLIINTWYAVIHKLNIKL
jgi:hypothetical protein